MASHAKKAQTKIWSQALRKAALEYAEGNRGPRKIEVAARAVVRKLIDGEMAAVREFGDRIDGKLATPIVGEDNGPISVTLRVFGNAAK